jgi:hypothetical protein
VLTQAKTLQVARKRFAPGRFDPAHNAPNSTHWQPEVISGQTLGGTCIEFEVGKN